jgi:hypothetical protein
MNGYLMQEQEWTPGQDLFIESFSPENTFGTVFEDDGDSAYFYAVEKDAGGTGLRVLDALHIFETEEEEMGNAEDDAAVANAAEGADAADLAEGADDKLRLVAGQPVKLLVVWSKDWRKCALVIGGLCHAIFDFAVHGGYSINEFPPPNDVWTTGDRKMTIERIRNF